MSSKRAIRRKACEGKVRYISSDEAATVLWHLKQAGKLEGSISAYHCQFCGQFHLGHAGLKHANGSAKRSPVEKAAGNTSRGVLSVAGVLDKLNLPMTTLQWLVGQGRILPHPKIKDADGAPMFTLAVLDQYRKSKTAAS